MTLRINHNIAALNGHRNMLRNDAAISRSLEKLSSGLRINRAADDAAGLVISEQMRAQITGLNQAIDNSETGVAMVQVAEGALDEVNRLLLKARELALHAANEGANDINQLEADQSELDNVLRSIARISDQAQFGTKKLLDGSLDGVSDLSAGLDRMRVGNLANNTAIETGTMTIAVDPSAYESNLLAGSTETDPNNWIFSAGAVTGLQAITSGTNINSGVAVTLNLDGRTFTVPVGSGGASVANVVEQFNTFVSGANMDFTVGYGATGGIDVSRTVFDSTDFAVSIDFSRGSGNAAGNVAASTASLSYTNGTESGVTTALFGTNNLSGTTTATTFAGSGSADFTVTTSGGTHIASVAISNGDSLNTVLSAVETSIQGAGIDLANASITLAVGSTGLGIDLTAGTGDAAQSVAFSLTLDNQNMLGQVDEVAIATGLMTDAFSSGVFGAENTGVVSGTTFASSGSVTITINGSSFSQASAAGSTLGAALTGIQDQVDAAFGPGIYTVGILAAEGDWSGVYSAAVDVNAFRDVASGNSVFYVARTDNSGDTDLSFSLSIDSNITTGLNFSTSGVEAIAGSVADASFDLLTVNQNNTSGITITAAQTGVSMTSVSGSTVNTAGTDGVTATLTTTSGLTLNFSDTSSSLTGATLGLTTGTANDGFQDISFEIDETVVGQTVTTNLLFTLDDGAVFQIGANDGQQIGVIIEDMDTSEIGRNVTNSGPLSSLADLASTAENALVNGFTDEAIRVIDAAIDEITTTRGRLGAFQSNTLEANLNSLRLGHENLTAAESTIRDVDFAGESAEFTKNNILVQSATAMLAQANQLPQNVLQLLQ